MTANTSTSPPSPPPPFTALPNLVSLNAGSRILFATDDFFSPAEHMLDDTDPVWKQDEYTTFGKWMDGWETRRKREAGHDWCLIELAYPGTIQGLLMDTAYFTGNQVPRISLQAVAIEDVNEIEALRKLQSRDGPKMGTKCSPQELESAMSVQSDKWETILDLTPLKPGYEESRKHYLEIPSSARSKKITHLRLNLFPDGGIARFRVYGTITPKIHASSETSLYDLIALENGGICVAYSNAHYGNPLNLLSRHLSKNMGDGWETSRNPERPAVFVKGPDGHLIIPGKHWAVIKCGVRGQVSEIEVDTRWFKGNFPESVIIEGTNSTLSDSEIASNPDKLKWFPLLPRTKLTAHTRHFFTTPQSVTAPQKVNAKELDKGEKECGVKRTGPEALVVSNTDVVTHVRVTMLPDGGISRVRVWGAPRQ